MLQLILGTAGTGKTTELVRRIRARAGEGKRCLYLVPEQSSQSAELLLFEALGERLSACAEAVSFRTLAERIERSCGGGALPVLSDAGRCVFVRRAITALDDRVQYYRRHRRNMAFLQSCAQAIGELKTAGAGSEDLAAAAAAAGSDKLAELALIYAATEAAVAGKAIDPSDRISRAARGMAPGMFADTWFYIDDFDGFTAPEYDLLRRLFEDAEGVSAALCCDGLADHDGGCGLFSPVKRAAAHLVRLSREAGRPVAAPLVLGENHRAQTAGLRAVDRLLAAPGSEDAPQADGVFLTRPTSREEECALIAAQVRALARAGVRYGEMAVVCRTLDEYAAPLRAAFARQQVPFFLDRAATAEYTAPVAFLRAALALARGGLATRPLLALVKSGLTGIPVEQACALENYAFTWQPGAADWCAEFAFNPNGFGRQRKPEDEAQRQLAEQARLRLLEPVGDFLAHSSDPTGLSLSRRLYLLLDAFGAPAQMTALAAQLRADGEPDATDEALQMWDTAMDDLDEMARLLGEDKVTPAEYDELFLLLVRGGEVGRVPRTMDTVLVTEADRTRLAEPAHVFVAGITEGDFPKTVGASGLLTHADRALLVEAGIEMPGSFENRLLLEQMFFYRALTSASAGLYLFAPQAAGGEPKSLSAPLAALAERLAPLPLAVTLPQRWAAPPAALAGLAARWEQPDAATAALRAALDGLPESAAALAQLARAARPRDYAVRDIAALHRLLGKRLTLSPSQIEQYCKCSYAYFLKYVLRLQVRRKAELSPIESGNFVHDVLEKALQRTGDDFADLPAEEVTALAAQLCNEYIAENIPAPVAQGVRFGYLVTRIKENLGRLLLYLQRERRQSGFEPVACELPIADDSDAVPLTVTAPDGHEVRVIGRIDRVDQLEREGTRWLRVIDYKTGDKTFRLDEVWCGLDLQMLLYLFTLCGQKKGPYAGSKPAGILYLKADPTVKSGGREQSAETKTYEVDGLLLDDEVVLRATDREFSGVFLPFKPSPTGAVRADTRAAKLADLAKLGRIEQHIEQLVGEMAGELYRGAVDARPLTDKKHNPCETCDFASVCGHVAGQNERPLTAPKHPFENEEAQKGGETDA